MHIYYIGFARIPTEKAHGLTIVKSCEAFARAGASVTLVVPARKNPLHKDVFETYGVERTFSVRYLPVLDLVADSRFLFWISYLTFYVSAFFFLLFARKKDAVIYTRDIPLLTLSIVGLSAILESHHVFKQQRLYFLLARCAKGIITISNALKQKFVTAGFNPQRLLVQPSGLDLSIFLIDTPQHEARQELGLPLDKKILLYTGNFTTLGEDKGISDILKALPAVSEALFVAVGGSEKDRVRYQKEAEVQRVEDRVRLEGYAPQRTLALYQRAADVLLMPFPDTPHYRSNMSPVKMFEYMASGVPIVATNLPTITEVLNAANASLVPPGNPQALVAAVEALFKDKERGQALALRAKQDARRYNWDERSERVLSFLKHGI
jgi:glycosyltransferase involved in cell wall biosynthesis